MSSECCDESIIDMEETQKAIFEELKDLPVGSEERSLAHKSIASLSNLIDYHRQRLGKRKPKRVYRNL